MTRVARGCIKGLRRYWVDQREKEDIAIGSQAVLIPTQWKGNGGHPTGKNLPLLMALTKMDYIWMEGAVPRR